MNKLKTKILCLGLASFTYMPASQGSEFEVLSQILMISQISINATYMGIIAAAGTAGTHETIVDKNDRDRVKKNIDNQRLDSEIRRVYSTDDQILNAGQTADKKIADNKRMMSRNKKNEAIQEQCKQDIERWKRVKELSQEITKKRDARKALDDARSMGLTLGS